MSQVNDIFDGLTEEDIAELTVDHETEAHIVVSDDRFITVPEALKRIAVQFDNDVETVTFDCPRYWDGLDMSKMSVRINYMRSDGYCDSYVAKNVTVDAADDSIMHFDWTISGNVTQVKGSLKFLVCVKKTGTDGLNINHWSSELNTDMFVSAGLECEETVFSSYPDIVTQVLLASERANDISSTLEEHFKNGDFTLGLPIVDENDNGRILRVENGRWNAGEMQIFEGQVVHETNNSVFIRYSANADGSDFTESWTPGQTYIGIAAAISAPINASAYKWVRMIAPLDQNMYGNAITNVVRGDIIRVDDVSPIEHTIKVKVGRGRNILPFPYYSSSKTINGVTITVNNDGSIILNGTTTGTIGFPLFVGSMPLKGNYTLSGVTNSMEFGESTHYLQPYIDEVFQSSVINGSRTYEINGNLTQVSLFIKSGYTFENTVIYPQLEPGDTKTEYDPYVDPSTVTLTRCGKNLIPFTSLSVTPSSTKATFTNDVLTVNGYLVSTRVPAIGLIGEKLCLSCTSVRSGEKGGGISVEFRDSNNAKISDIYKQNELSPCVSFTVPENTVTIVVFFYASANADETGTAIYRNIQLEFGDNKTDCESYNGQTYTPSSDGTVDIHSVSPTMTVFTDTEGAILDITYNSDLNTVAANIKASLDNIIAIQEEFMIPNGDEVSY